MGWEYHNRHRDRRGRFFPTKKTEQLHIRCTDQQRAAIAARAAARFMNMSEYVLDLVQRDLMGVQPGITVGGEKNV